MLAIGLATVPLLGVGLGLVGVSQAAVEDLALEVQLAVVEDVAAQIADEMRATDELFTILTEIVFRHGGLVDKFIGDCVMAIWGAPETQPDHTERAMPPRRRCSAGEVLPGLNVGLAGGLGLARDRPGRPFGLPRRALERRSCPPRRPRRASPTASTAPRARPSS